MKPLLIALVATVLLAAAPSNGLSDAEIDGLLMAADLPAVTMELRQLGVEDAEIRMTLTYLRNRQIPAAEARAFFEECATAIQRYGPVQEFAALIDAQLAQGMRGAVMASAVRDAHRRQSVGLRAD